MKKNKFLAIVAIASITGFFVPEVIAQNAPVVAPVTAAPVIQSVPDASNAPVADKNSGSNLRPQFIMRTSADYERGATLFAGINLSSRNDDSKFPEMSLLGSFGIPSNSTQMTSFGLTYIVYPMHGRFSQLWGFGVESIYFYSSNIDMYSELFFGGLGQNTIKDPSAQWITKRLVVAPVVEFSIPIGQKIRIGSKINPLIWGYWDFLPQNNSFSHWRRWYDIDLFYFSYLFGKNE